MQALGMAGAERGGMPEFRSAACIGASDARKANQQSLCQRKIRKTKQGLESKWTNKDRRAECVSIHKIIKRFHEILKSPIREKSIVGAGRDAPPDAQEKCCVSGGATAGGLMCGAGESACAFYSPLIFSSR
jgi:hypothetical protein